MKDDDLQMVNWFKGQYKSYLASTTLRRKLEEKVTELDNILEYHSPSLSSDVHGSGKTNDEKLADLITRKEKYVNQLVFLKAQQEAVECVLRRMSGEYKESIRRIYSGLATIEGEALRRGLVKATWQTQLDGEILKAVKRYLNS